VTSKPGSAAITAVVLAAGAASRFGGVKLLAEVRGKPVLQHVLDAIDAAGLTDVVVVLGTDAETIEAAIDWRGERRVRNPEPERGLSSSVAIGLAAVPEDAAGALIVLGDQPGIRPESVGALLEQAGDPANPVVVPRYADDAGRNPVLLDRAAFPLAAEATGDRGLGPVLSAHADLVREVPLEGANPDVDTRADLARAIEADWAARVRANREQVDRFREVPDGQDFYAPVRSLFRADPTRTDDPVLDVLLRLVHSGDSWLDVGAGAGRFALPLARALDESGGFVIAVEVSPSMLEALREIADDHAIENIRTVEARWPVDDASARDLEADVGFIAHVGYDIEEIGSFLDALESASRRLCVAVLMERVPASAADPFWPPVHGERRVPLPALPDALELLQARGREPSLTRVEIEPRRFDSREALGGFVRRQLWIDPAGPKEARFQAALDELTEQDADGWTITGRMSSDVGIVTWRPATNR
jgi:CTP:molybdopterin cytidylyltransferase MocA/SAM-dependent methyltransferase